MSHWQLFGGMMGSFGASSNNDGFANGGFDRSFGSSSSGLCNNCSAGFNSLGFGSPNGASSSSGVNKRLLPVPPKKTGRKLRETRNASANQPPARDSCIGLMRNLLETKEDADIMFVVGHEDKAKQEILAHRLLLSAASPVFKIMFRYDATNTSIHKKKNKKEGGGHNYLEKPVNVPDIEPDVFNAMIEYIYTGTATLNEQNVFDLLYAAKKYELDGLRNMCIDFADKKLKPSNVFAILLQARFYGEKELESICLEFIEQNTLYCITTSEFAELVDQKLLCEILDLELDVNEYDIYDCITTKWAEKQCARKEIEYNPENLVKFRTEIFGEAFHKIRFPLIDMRTFSDSVVPKGLLTAQEIISLYRHYSGSHPSDSYPLTFSSEKRIVGDLNGKCAHVSFGTKRPRAVK